uniref:Uncharacterized protein n=1 Tax=Knipowitschia caucasica TaxID=637954 RepID=A0AAV2LBS5_KNICA
MDRGQEWTGKERLSEQAAAQGSRSAPGDAATYASVKSLTEREEGEWVGRGEGTEASLFTRIQGSCRCRYRCSCLAILQG